MAFDILYQEKNQSTSALTDKAELPYAPHIWKRVLITFLQSHLSSHPMGSHLADNELFDSLSNSWWSENGYFNLLKWFINPWRLPYFKAVIAENGIDPRNKRVLDVGCGGGLLAEEIASMGFSVTGSINQRNPSRWRELTLDTPAWPLITSAGLRKHSPSKMEVSVWSPAATCWNIYEAGN